jgi:hypothetical protein
MSEVWRYTRGDQVTKLRKGCGNLKLFNWLALICVQGNRFEHVGLAKNLAGIQCTRPGWVDVNFVPTALVTGFQPDWKTSLHGVCLEWICARVWTVSLGHNRAEILPGFWASTKDCVIVQLDYGASFISSGAQFGQVGSDRMRFQ